MILREADAEFLADMEDALSTDERPHDERRVNVVNETLAPATKTKQHRCCVDDGYE